MQIRNNTRFIKSFMVGLVASSAGALVALPGSAMPEATEVGVETDVIAPVEALSEPTAAEALPMPEASATDVEVSPVEVSDTDVSAEADALAETDVVETDGVEVVEEPTTEEMPVAEEAIEEPVAADEAVEEAAEEPVAAEEAITDEVDAPLAEESLEAPAEETAAEEMNTEDFTIAELTGNSDSFEILAAALEAAELSEVLSGEGPFTVFAPTDEAFEALPEGAVEQLLLPENKEVLIQVLTYHVVPGAVLSTELKTGAVATVEGSELAVEVSESVTVNNANVIAVDVTASNGVIHVIDSVILPPAPEAGVEPTDDTASAQ